MSEICPTCGHKNRPKQPTGGYHETVAHILETFEKRKGARYPFSAVDGKTVKRLLHLYSSPQVRALWDAFLDLNDEWMQKVGHTLFQFQRSIPVLLDKSDWKSRARKYEGAVNVEVTNLVTFRGVPHKNDAA